MKMLTRWLTVAAGLWICACGDATNGVDAAPGQDSPSTDSTLRDGRVADSQADSRVDAGADAAPGDLFAKDGVPAGDAFTPSCAPYRAPAGAIAIAPGKAIQKEIKRHPPGSAFLLKAGVHRLQEIRPRKGDVFYGELDGRCNRKTILSGARLLTAWKKSGSKWVHGGQTQSGQVHGVCESGWSRCSRPEDLFFDDKPLKHVASAGAVGTGSWYFDYGADRVFIGNDPTGHKVEIGTARVAFDATATGVKIYALIVEKYAIPPQMGAIGEQYPKSDWVIEGNEVRLNHGVGISIGSRTKAIDNFIHHNGQMGIAAEGSLGLIEGNEIAFNNFAHVKWGWEAGGSKFALTDGLKVVKNKVHHNRGPGLWTDIDNINTLYEGNVVFDNSGPGIFHEISDKATIRNNTVSNNGGGQPVWLWGAGILVAASANVEVSGNILKGNANGIAGIQQARGRGKFGARLLKNLYVHNNQVTLVGRAAVGVVQDVNDNSVFTSRNNRFEKNAYRGSFRGAWKNGWISTFSKWQATGNDKQGSYNP